MKPSPQAFRSAAAIHRAGLAADRPEADDVLAGTLYFSTDSGVLERSDGTTWAAYSAGGGGLAPSVTEGQLLGRGSTSGDGPAEEINPGEYIAMTGDQIDVAGAGATSFIVQSLAAARAEVAGLGKAPGDYLPNAQEMALSPTGYVRNTGGTGVLSTVATIPASDVTGLPALPPTIAYTDRANVFGPEQIVQASAARLSLVDTDQPTDRQRFRLINSGQYLRVHATNDAGTVQLAQPFFINRGGDVGAARDVFEKDRPVAIGHWQNLPFNPVHFSGLNGLVWTVGAGAVLRNRYALIGQTVIWSLYLSWFSGGNGLSGTPGTTLVVNGLPVTVQSQQTGIVAYQGGTANTPIVAGLVANGAGTGVQLSKADGTNFSLADVPGLITTFTFEVG